MKKTIITFMCIALMHNLMQANEDWDIFYWNNQVGTGVNMQSEIHFGPDGLLYLVEIDNSDMYNSGSFLHIRSYDTDQWSGDNFTQEGWISLGQPLPLHLPNNATQVDFAIASDHTLYAGMLDTIYVYHTADSGWEPYYVPDYIGGMYASESGELLVLRSVTAGEDHHFEIAAFDAGNLTTVAVIAYELPGNITFYPRILAEANRIMKYGNDYYVSIARASTHQNYYFKGNADMGFEMLQEHFNHLNLSSMAISPAGELIVSHRGASSPYTLEIKSYDFEIGEWVQYDTTGLHAVAAHANDLKFDKNGNLYLTYSGQHHMGFAFRYTENGWEHLGARDALSIAHMPALAFDHDNRLYLLHGIGATTVPLLVRRYADETTGLEYTAENIALTVFPNPAKDRVHVRLQGAAVSAALSLLDQSGRVIKQQRMDQQGLQLDVTDLMPGVYTLIVTNQDLYAVRKLLVR